MPLDLEVLGFAGAAPLGGACPAYLVSSERTSVLLDCGPGALERLWERRVLRALDAIVISHMHVDHVLDLVLLSGEVVRRLLDGHRPALYLPAGEGRDVLARVEGAFPRGAPADGVSRFDAAFEVREYAVGDRLTIGDLAVDFALAAHGPGACHAIRVSDGAASVVYGADGGPSDAVAELATGADVLVLEATFLDDEELAGATGHMTAGQAGAVAARSGARELVLTHLLPGAGDDLVQRAREAFAGDVVLASEGLRRRAG